MFTSARKILAATLAAATCAFLLSGCASLTKSKEEPVFYPAAPNDPRVQYLGSISDSTDIEGEKGGFSFFVKGKAGGEVVKKVGKASGLAVRSGKLYVASVGGKDVVIIDFVNKTFDFLKGNVGAGKLKKPVAVAVDDQENIYVADAGREEIVVYDRAGNYVAAYGKGFDAGKIVGVAVYGDQIYALDNRDNQILVLDKKTGAVITSIAKAAPDADVKATVHVPSAITTDDKGFIYVTNVGRGNVQKFDRDGNLLLNFGRFGDSWGEFSRPRGIAIDKSGQIYVVDAGFQHVQVFDESTRVLGAFGDPNGKPGSMNLPSGIAISTDNLEMFQKEAAPGFKLDAVAFVANQYVSAINGYIGIYGIGQMEGSKPVPAADVPADKQDKEGKRKRR